MVLSMVVNMMWMYLIRGFGRDFLKVAKENAKRGGNVLDDYAVFIKEYEERFAISLDEKIQKMYVWSRPNHAILGSAC